MVQLPASLLRRKAALQAKKQQAEETLSQVGTPPVREENPVMAEQKEEPIIQQVAEPAPAEEMKEEQVSPAVEVQTPPEVEKPKKTRRRRKKVEKETAADDQEADKSEDDDDEKKAATSEGSQQ